MEISFTMRRRTPRKASRQPLCAPIPQVAQEVPLGVQHAGLTKPVHIVIRRQMMQLQAVDLAA